MSAADLFQSAVAHLQAGRLAEAEATCRQVLQQAPGHPAALHLMGAVALQAGQADAALDWIGRAVGLQPDNVDAQISLARAFALGGRIDDAEAVYRRIVALAPGRADAHFQWGVLCQQQERLSEAAAHYRQALTLAPNHFDAANNLGVALQASGELDAAIATFRALIARAPAQAQAQLHYNLGNAEKAKGLLTESIASYRQALALAPDFVDALDNLGVACQESGDADAALDCYRRVLAYQPDAMPTLCNLALVHLTLANYVDALAASRRALQLQSDAQTQTAFAQCVRPAHFTQDDPALRASLIEALTAPWCRPIELVAAALSLVRCNPALDAAIARAHAAWPAREATLDGLDAAAGDKLLHRLLTVAPSSDWAVEVWLTHARAELLARAQRQLSAAGGLPSAELGFWCALAQQCYINGYVFALADDEARDAEALRTAVATAIATNGEIPALALAAVGAYFPLHALPAAAQLRARVWPGPVRDLLTLQVDEPLRERQLRREIPVLTPIDNAVSRLVQAQYEVDPYPCWVRPAPTGEPLAFNAHLRWLCPFATFRPLPELPTVDVLIAGCGTGQHALETARQIRGAQVLALDLSLTSLAYARRKTEESGVANLRYAQADIAALGALEQRFDVIESVGVLHHMADPVVGWQNLLALLKPGGFLRIGLYSELARHVVVAAREFISAHGYQGTAAEIRRCRQQLVRGEDGFAFAQKVSTYRDFFSTAECRDLLFHVQEHRLRLPQLKALLATLEVDFVGFTLEAELSRRYRARFPADQPQTDLYCWDIFEQENPDTFAGMYQFWVQKRG